MDTNGDDDYDYKVYDDDEESGLGSGAARACGERAGALNGSNSFIRSLCISVVYCLPLAALAVRL